jgi:hypothetical protein
MELKGTIVYCDERLADATAQPDAYSKEEIGSIVQEKGTAIHTLQRDFGLTVEQADDRLSEINAQYVELTKQLNPPVQENERREGRNMPGKSRFAQALRGLAERVEESNTSKEPISLVGALKQIATRKKEEHAQAPAPQRTPATRNVRKARGE